jgi:hypothetical protein
MNLRQKEVQMANWKQFEKNISEWLETFESADVKFCKKFPIGEFRSDGMLMTDQVLVAIEIEAGQTHPDTNVGKYWLLNDRKPYRRIVLFHVYTPDFKSYQSRKELGEFYAGQMQGKVPIEYISCDYRNTAKGYQAILAEIKTEIETIVKQEFGIANAR